MFVIVVEENSSCQCHTYTKILWLNLTHQSQDNTKLMIYSVWKEY